MHTAAAAATPHQVNHMASMRRLRQRGLRRHLGPTWQELVRSIQPLRPLPPPPQNPRPLARPPHMAVTCEPRGYLESRTMSLILNDTVKAGHTTDVASRAETDERRSIAEITLCRSYTPAPGHLRVCSMPMQTLAARQPGTMHTRRRSRRGRSCKLQLLPRKDARRVLLWRA